MPTDKKLVILQGSGINIQRGAEEAVEAMSSVEETVLLILGSGDVINTLKDGGNQGLKHKVIFKDRMPYDEMMAHTKVADLGLTLDKNTNINYQFSLPNKLFDYINAGIPVLASDLKEVKSIVEGYEIGEIVEEVTAESVASKMKSMLASSKQSDWRSNCKKAAEDLNWEKESEVLRNLLVEING